MKKKSRKQRRLSILDTTGLRGLVIILIPLCRRVAVGQKLCKNVLPKPDLYQ